MQFLVKNINANGQLDDLWKYIKVKTHCWLLSLQLPHEKIGAKPHLKCGAWAVSLGSEMWGLKPGGFLAGTRLPANEPARTKVSSKWAERKVNKPGDKLQISGHQVSWMKILHRAHRPAPGLFKAVTVSVVKSCWGPDFFVRETLTARRCSFQRQPSPLRRALLGRRWMLDSRRVCLGSALYAQCLGPAWYLFLFFSSYLSAHFLRERSRGLPKKTHNLLTKSVRVDQAEQQNT